ncbi:iron ABC transporter permease [Galactobacter caseinivorans]|uniref:Iron ABC transporter permease n=1 Tax=Galactobacter caseinivorans TaxID=2676123 RepID=A0A496PHV3_9MICC|nr:iron ABC transporter permease [Galactobacter caseinivorans]RKW70055.1 iron ABC transporter permease [Galactobacter caseinivorans]
MRSTTRPQRALAGAGTLLALALALAAFSVVHLTQGSSGTSGRELVGALAHPGTGGGVVEILWGSRVPRLLSGLVVGGALGVAGLLLQSVARNPLASPDTLAVTAGSAFAVTAVSAFGLSIPWWASGSVAAVGGLAAAALVLALAGGASTATARLVLAGSAVAMALQSGSSALLILFTEETTGLFAWGNGSLNQLNIDASARGLPVLLLCLVLAVALSRRLDVVSVGDDAARVVGVPVRSTRVGAVVLAVIMTAVAVTLAGPIGFVGLCAPAAARLLARGVPALRHHVWLIPAAALMGALVVVLSDVAVRAILGADRALTVPTGVVTSILGAVVLIILAARSRSGQGSAGGVGESGAAAGVVPRGRARVLIVTGVAAVALAGSVVGSLLLGQRKLLLGDLFLWAQGEAPRIISLALDERAPRVAAALLAGAALGLVGLLVQSTARNPLAEPGLLGVSGGAGLGAVLALSVGGTAAATLMLPAAVAGGLLAFALVYALAWRGGIDPGRLVLVGIGVGYLTVSVTTFILLRTDPFNTPKIFTWLSGTTYERVWADVAPVALGLAVVVALAVALSRDMDLLAVGEDTPRLLGLRLERTRLLVLVASAVLASLAVLAIGTVGFVGLVAPHAARAMVGVKHRSVLAVSMLLGSVLVVIADAIGRTVLAPAQLPVGLLVALIGAPYFIYLLSRTRV